MNNLTYDPIDPNLNLLSRLSLEFLENLFTWLPVLFLSAFVFLPAGEHVPEEDVLGLAAGVGVYQLLFQVLQGAVVDVDWTL